MSATIFALSTPPGRSAIAVLRLSGPRVVTVLEVMCPPRPEPRRAVVRKLCDPRTRIVLDEALVLYFASPRSETGEDMAELQLHGGRAIVRAVLEALAAIPGCRPAEPGEFARRAFENGKLDLAQIEGIADLIDAETEGQRAQAVAQASGAQSKRFQAWRADVLAALGLVEAAIDFSDEADVSERAVSQAEKIARTLRADLMSQLDDGHRGEILREGFRVVLAGPPNAGKSSLLNALARREAAIVSEEAGTTRDVIDVRLDLEGLAVIVSDTAGLRETSSRIEQEGIRRTLAATREADLVVWLSEATAFVTGDDAGTGIGAAQLVIPALESTDAFAIYSVIPAKAGTQATIRNEIETCSGTGLDRCDDPIIDQSVFVCAGISTSDERRAGASELRVLTKLDLVGPGPTIHVKHGRAGAEQVAHYDFAISAKTGVGLDGLTAHIAACARAATGNPADPAITRVRHRREIAAAVGHLDAFLGDQTQPVELRVEDLRLAGIALGRLTGRIDAEEVLGEIFSRFCIGK